MNNETFKKTAEQITHTVIEKNRAYGDSVNRAPQCLAILAPDGIQPHQYRDASLAVRLLDKIARGLAMPPGSDEENPWADAAGYCLIRANEVRIEAKRARYVRCSVPEASEAQIAEAAEILQWLAEHFGEGSPELEELRSIGRFADFRRRNPPKSSPEPAPTGVCGLENDGKVCLLNPGHRGEHFFEEVEQEPPSLPRYLVVPSLKSKGFFQIQDSQTGMLWNSHAGLWKNTAKHASDYGSETHAKDHARDLLKAPAPEMLQVSPKKEAGRPLGHAIHLCDLWVKTEGPQCLRPLGHEGICNR